MVPGGLAMLRLASVCLMVSVGSEIFSILDEAKTSGPAPLLGLISFSLFLIFLILGLPATRKLLD
jgi:peptidoglycan/LPS O-acetylase OafA/YrhL